MTILNLVISLILLTGISFIIKEDREEADKNNTETLFSDFEILCCFVLSVIPFINILFLIIIIHVLWKNF